MEKSHRETPETPTEMSKFEGPETEQKTYHTVALHVIKVRGLRRGGWLR